VWEHGAGQGTDDLVVVFVGTGIGGGVSDGRMLTGHQGLAGKLGHTTIMPYGRDCHCQDWGCWEAYAGGWAIAERAREAVQTDPAEPRERVVACPSNQNERSSTDL
jgi:glucokinase